MIGRVLVGHRIEGVIGEGGMGVVYRACHERLGLVRALKVLPRRLAEDHAFRERFEREWQLAAKVAHPNIVEVFDAGEDDGHLYILMRLIEGRDLGRLLQEDGPLEAWRALRILAQIGDALDSAHARGLVHRDVKPGNILVAQGDHASLTDFGIAKMTATRGVTRGGFFVGTANYSAPEQIEGREVDGRADVYALGGVLYTCLTSEAPYERDSEVQVMFAHLRDPAPVLTEHRPDLPPALDTVIERALQKSKDERYGSCGELIAASQAALRSTPESMPTVRSEAQQRDQTVSSPDTLEETVAQTQVELPERHRPRRRLGVLVAAAAVAVALVGLGIGLFAVFGGGSGGAEGPDLFEAMIRPNGRVYFEGATMYVETVTPGQPLLVPANVESSLRDVGFSARARWESGARDFGVGLVCRYENANNYYLLSVLSGGRYNIVKYDAGKLVSLSGGIRTNSAIAEGANDIAVQCRGDAPAILTLTVNGEQVGRVEDSSPIGGGTVGIRVGSIESGVVVSFTNVRLRSL